MRRPADFRRVLSKGARSRRGAVTVASAPGQETAIRVGLVVGRDVGNAVRRNRVKRRIRHALKDTSLEQGMDYVIIAGAQAGEVEFSRLREWLTAATREVR